RSILEQGSTLDRPRAMASAASSAVRLPLNLSGAITTRMVADLDRHYPGKEVGQALQPDKSQSQAFQPDLHALHSCRDNCQHTGLVKDGPTLMVGRERL